MPYLSSIPWVVTSFTHKKRDLATLVHPTAYELSWFLMAYACSICSQVYWWHDKYRPRKPKYFNRVHTGYEWNKYNQTHYDHDNPPPKIVQGYKFNIFYPDLVDKSKAPTYSIEKDGRSSDFNYIYIYPTTKKNKTSTFFWCDILPLSCLPAARAIFLRTP